MAPRTHIAVTALAALLVATALSACKDRSAPLPTVRFPVPEGMDPFSYYCRDDRGRVRTERIEDSTLPPPNTRGLSRRFYQDSRFFEADPISLQDVNMLGLPAYRSRTMREKALEFLREPPVTWPTNHLLTLADKPTLFEDLVEQRRGTLADLVNIMDHEAWVDCRAATYNYRVKFWILRDEVRVVREDVRSSIDARLTELLERLIERQGGSGGTIVINTNVDLVQQLAADPELRRELRERLTPEELARIRTVAPDVWNFLQILLGSESIYPFPSGEYRLSGEMAYAVDLTVRTWLRMRDRGQSYEIVSRGFADSRAVRPAGIEYDQDANLELGARQAAPYAAGERPGLRTIHDNLELSIARGYSGARQVDQTLREAVTSPDERATITVRYSGGGPVAEGALDVNRRIDLVISPVTAQRNP